MYYCYLIVIKHSPYEILIIEQNIIYLKLGFTGLAIRDRVRTYFWSFHRPASLFPVLYLVKRERESPGLAIQILDILVSQNPNTINTVGTLL